METKKGEGLRFNEGKLRYDLVHPWAHEQMVKILTKGSIKYKERNWEAGMRWSNVISSLKRHLAAIEKGEDFDIETGELHASHLACNAHFLTAYYKIFPEGDDRPHKYLKHPKIGLDLDEVIIDFVGGYCERFNLPIAQFWNFDIDMKAKFEALKTDKDFWMSLKPKINAKDMPFEPHAYITSRNIPIEWTKEWLHTNGFPSVPVYSVPINTSKLEMVVESGVDWFVDDKFETFVELNNNGICCFLFDAPHNQKYSIGFKRIKELKDLMQ